MRIISVDSKHPGIDKVILFTENEKDDYLYNHQLSISSDVEESTNEKLAKQYDKIPDAALGSNRQCFVKPISITVKSYE